MKKSIGSETYLFPLPSVVVGTYDKQEVPNMMVASWTGIVNSKPSMVSVSLRQATYSHDSIIETGAFTISIPSRKHIIEMDYVGTISGKKENKFETTNLNPIKSELVNAPYVAEFPIVLECKLVKYDNQLGLHTLFIGEILDVKIDTDYLKANGMPDMAKIDPIAYAHGDREYYEIGEYLGKANRMWQFSLYSSVTRNDADKKDIMKLILDYYEKLDNSDPIEEFDDLIDWENFEMSNGNFLVDTYEKYLEWYSEVINSVFNRKHIIERIQIEKIDENRYKVIMDMYFRANTWKKGDAKPDSIKAVSDIHWIVAREDNTKDFRLQKYEVFMK